MPKALYGFGGYKIWIGSLAADDATLISDGSDNTIICHKFDEERTRSNLNSMCYLSTSAQHIPSMSRRRIQRRRARGWIARRTEWNEMKPARGRAVGHT